ncbi:MAG: oligosaccharide flippase family protein [Nitrososphaerales archaeon]
MGWLNAKLKLSRLDNGFAYVTLGNLCSGVLGAIFWLILASMLIAEGYGQLNYLLSLTFIFGTVALLGLNPTVTTFMAKGNRRIRYQANTLALVSSMAFIAPLILLTGYVFLSVLLIGVAFFHMSMAEILGRKQYKEYMLILAGQRAVQIAFGISVYFLLGIDGIILGYTISFLAFSYRYFLTVKYLRPSIQEIRSNFKFTMHSYAMELARTVSMFSDKLLIAPLFGFTMLGIYQLGAQFLIFLGMIPTILYHYLLPQEASGIHSRKISLGAFAISSILAIGFIAAVPWIITNFFPNFADSILPAQIMSMGIVPLTITSILGSRFLGMEQSRPVFIGAIVYVATQYVTIMILGNMLGIVGLALSLIIALTAQAACLLVANRMWKPTIAK